MPLAEFCRWASNQTGASIVVSENLDSRPVSVDLVEQSLDDSLGVVARRAGVQITRTGNLYFVGDLRPEDRGILVRRVRRLDKTEILQALNTMKSNVGQSVAFDDGLIIVGDRVEVLTKVSNLIDQIESADSSTWHVQLFIVDLSQNDLHDIGADVIPSIDLSLTMANASSNVIPTLESSHRMQATLQSLLRLTKERTSSNLIAEPMFYLLDGQNSKYVEGDQIPVPIIEDVQNGGQTVRRVTFQQIQTGLTVDVTLREISPGSAKLKTILELSTQKGLVLQQAPIISKETYNTEAMISSGGVYLLGSMKRAKGTGSKSAGTRFGNSSSQEERVLQIWARAARTNGPALTPNNTEFNNNVPYVQSQ